MKEKPQQEVLAAPPIRVEIDSMIKAKIGGQAIVLARRHAALQRKTRADDIVKVVKLASDPEQLPLTLGHGQSADLIEGLKIMATASMVDAHIAHSEFNPESAREWLEQIKKPKELIHEPPPAGAPEAMLALVGLAGSIANPGTALRAEEEGADSIQISRPTSIVS